VQILEAGSHQYLGRRTISRAAVPSTGTTSSRAAVPSTGQRPPNDRNLSDKMTLNQEGPERNLDMPKIDARETGGQEQDIMPFAGKATGSLFAWSMLVPLAFIVVHLAGFQLLGIDRADKVIEVISYVGPVIQPQYEFLKSLGRNTEAANYAAFCVLLSLLSIVMSIRATIFFITRRPILRGISWKDSVIIMAGSLFYMILILWKRDVPVTEFKLLVPLYFDTFGFYYIRQYCLYFILHLTFAIITITLLKLSRDALRSLRDTSRIKE